MKESGWVNARLGPAQSIGFTAETEQGRECGALCVRRES